MGGDSEASVFLTAGKGFPVEAASNVRLTHREAGRGGAAESLTHNKRSEHSGDHESSYKDKSCLWETVSCVSHKQLPVLF